MMIYLAGPYSHEDKAVEAARAAEHAAAAATLILRGHVVFSPIVHSHQMSLDHDLPGDFDFWQRQDLAFIERCDEVHVLMIAGWDTSKGVAAEMLHAIRCHKAVRPFSMGGYLGEVPVGWQRQYARAARRLSARAAPTTTKI